MVKFFSIKMKHVPEASDIPSFADAVGAGSGTVEHQLDVVAQASGFTEKESADLEAFVAKEGWGGGGDAGDDDEEDDDDDEDEETVTEIIEDGREGCRSANGHPPEDEGEQLDGEEGSLGGGACESDEGGGVDGGEGETSSEEGKEDRKREGKVRRVKAPESVTKRAHAAVQRQRVAAGGRGAGGSTSRNKQKKKEKGKMLYKHRDF